METEFFIALVGALVNMVLSVIIPCLLRKSDQSFLVDIKKVFQTNREVIFASSLIVAITIYLALTISPELQALTESNNDDSLGPFLRGPNRFPTGLPPGLQLLGRL
jgi:hypothetical protein